MYSATFVLVWACSASVLPPRQAIGRIVRRIHPNAILMLARTVYRRHLQLTVDMSETGEVITSCPQSLIKNPDVA